jgi:hypothetical protein
MNRQYAAVAAAARPHSISIVRVIFLMIQLFWGREGGALPCLLVVFLCLCQDSKRFLCCGSFVLPVAGEPCVALMSQASGVLRRREFCGGGSHSLSMVLLSAFVILLCWSLIVLERHFWWFLSCSRVHGWKLEHTMVSMVEVFMLAFIDESILKSLFLGNTYGQPKYDGKMIVYS